MLTSIDIKEARRSMRTAIFVCGGGGLMFTATFLFVLFRPFFPAQALLIIAAIAGGIGLVHGWYWTYRTACGTTYLLLRVGLVVFLMEILLGGSAAASLGSLLLNSLFLSWLGLGMHWLLVTLSLAAGMRREAKALGMFNPSTASAWKAALERHIDYAAGLMSPTVMALRSTTEPSESAWAKALPIGFAGALGPNIYWLFDRYGGGGNNALCFMPIMTAAICYMNWKTIGPGLLRLLLLRKLEKAAGRRFINTDYPQIQQLRSGFFLARWLMKDYATAKAMREEADAKAAAPPPPKPRRGSARLRRKEAHQNRHQKDRAAPSDRPDSN